MVRQFISSALTMENQRPSRTKLDDRAIRCLFLGYSTTTKGCRCYDPQLRCVIHTMDVIFHEEVPFFPAHSTPRALPTIAQPLPVVSPPPDATPSVAPPVLLTYSRRPPPSPHASLLSFYLPATLPRHDTQLKSLKDATVTLRCLDLNFGRVSGGIILAPEGINGSICGALESVEKVLEFIQSDERLRGLRIVESPVTPEEEAIHHGHTSHSPLGAGEDAPFRWDHVRVKLKKEIVTFGDTSVLPTERVGKYVHPRDWNMVISDPNTVLIDVRNMYETRIGKFKGAVDPCTTSFREFPSWVNAKFQVDGLNTPQLNFKDDNGHRLPRVAMYCTGGIRCEKASSFLLGQGFAEIYIFEGGDAKYREEIPLIESSQRGQCKVGDKRISNENTSKQRSFKLCYGCKQPVSEIDMESAEWEFGVSCPHCFTAKSEEEKERARARQRQFESYGIIGGPDKGRRRTMEKKRWKKQSKIGRGK
ncbi:Rhodanese-like domain-containing protein 7 [Platanthera guangdongensis]|uniref:Rhodanese-like domain-containing protein 7 n=1 Tax=Platanthera guangdongensis TaxID=2320717 RepID=A0ABR2MJK9_9ASPA